MKDYSKEELIQVIDSLLGVHRSKLKSEEKVFLEHYRNNVGDSDFPSHVRDNIIAMYDRMGESNYD